MRLRRKQWTVRRKSLVFLKGIRLAADAHFMRARLKATGTHLKTVQRGDNSNETEQKISFKW
jgi:hypothetical protein